MKHEKYKIECLNYTEGYGSDKYTVYSISMWNGKKWKFLGGYDYDTCLKIKENDMGEQVSKFWKKRGLLILIVFIVCVTSLLIIEYYGPK